MPSETTIILLKELKSISTLDFPEAKARAEEIVKELRIRIADNTF
jgi:hypothetical protein